MSTSTDVLKSEIKSLSPEILLKIFLKLDSHETVILRSVCKELLEVIDNNKSLWRILDWIQQEEESPIQALEMFDEKSGSTLTEVSIFQKRGMSDDHLLKVLDRSKNTLTDISLKFSSFGVTFRPKLIELASNSHFLNSLVLCPSDEDRLYHSPRTRLTRSCRQRSLSTERSSSLRVMWCFRAARDWDAKLDVSSLISFADPSLQDPLQLHSFITKFSSTLIHLSVMSNSSVTNTPPLSCPSLRILEGRFYSVFPSWLDAPNLRIIIARYAQDTFMKSLPVSLQEIWLLHPESPLMTPDFWDFLPLVCPELNVMKIGRDCFERDLAVGGFLAAFRSRQDRVEEGAEIKGTKMVPLEKLIIPTELFEPGELDQLRDIVGEIVDINDYPGFIELEY